MLSTTWHILAYLTAASALIPLVFSLFSDRSRGRRRCPKCWYTLDGLTPTSPLTYTCPECAHQSPESRLYKTRIRYRLLPLPFIILAISYTLWAIPRVMKEGWTGWVPTTALVVTVAGPDVDPLTVHSETFNKLRETFDERHKARHLWSWQASLLESTRYVAFARVGRSGPDSTDRGLFDLLSTTYLRHSQTQPLTIAEVCDSVTRATGIPILFDAEDVRKWGDCFSTNVDLPPCCTAVGALDQVFRRYFRALDPDFTWRVNAGAIHVFMHDESDSLFVTYPVADLLEEHWVVPSPWAFSAVPYWADRSRELIDAITGVVTPPQWYVNGGDSNTTFEVIDGRMWIIAPSRTHLELGRLLTAIRNAQGLIVGESRQGVLQSAREVYRKLYRASLGCPDVRPSIGALLVKTSETTNVSVEPDWSCLESRLITPELLSHAQFGPWNCLEMFSRAVGRNWPNSGLDWWTPDVRDGVVVVTDARRLSDTPLLVVHDVGDFVSFQRELERNDKHLCTVDDEIANQVLDLVTSTVDPESWVSNGGDLASSFRVGHKLIIQARPFTQARVADLLDMIRAHRGKPEINW